MPDKTELHGKRLASLDYGRKRVGFAVCDELHITVSPRKFYDITDPKFWDILLADLVTERVYAIIVGVPYRHDTEETEMIIEIKAFIEEVKTKSSLQVYEQDEAFSSREAMTAMIGIGKKKKKRAQKGTADMVAAAVILRDFLNELEG